VPKPTLLKGPAEDDRWRVRRQRCVAHRTAPHRKGDPSGSAKRRGSNGVWLTGANGRGMTKSTGRYLSSVAQSSFARARTVFAMHRKSDHCLKPLRCVRCNSVLQARTTLGRVLGGTMVKKGLCTFLLAIAPAVAFAGPITFDLRALSVESVDDVGSFTLASGDLMATISASPTSLVGRNLLLNRTASSFGVNVDETTCDSTEDSALIDGGCGAESIAIAFNTNVLLNSLFVSSFGSQDSALVTAGLTAWTLASTGTKSLNSAFLGAGELLIIAYTAGNGFSLDSFTATATPTPEPATLALLGLGLAGAAIQRRRAVRRRA
jgi:hypothetical protein